LRAIAVLVVGGTGFSGRARRESPDRATMCPPQPLEKPDREARSKPVPRPLIWSVSRLTGARMCRTPTGADATPAQIWNCAGVGDQ
jgi:hypothetical protein